MRRLTIAWLIILALAAVAGATTLGQPTPEGFSHVPAEEILWLPSPTVKGGQVAYLLGEPQKAGPLVVRVKLPPGTEVMPHTHPDARTYTVLAGEWKLGFGERFDQAGLRSYRAGSLYRLPSRVPHFQAVGSVETIVQIESIGPTSTDFLNRAVLRVKPNDRLASGPSSW